MKRIFFAFGMSSLMILSCLSCNNTGNKNTSAETTKAGQAQSEAYPGYTMVWADEFEGDAIDTTNWNFQVLEAGHFNAEWQRYTNSDKNAFIEDGKLVIRAIHESDVHGMDQYTSARLNTANKQSWKYGKILARMKLPYGNGLWPAFWMLGANIDENGGDTHWPQAGEIDILELYGSVDAGVVEANIHYADSLDSYAKMGAIPYKLEEGTFADDYHIFELDWDADSIAWLVDGEQYASTAITSAGMEEFHMDFFILLNVAVGGRAAGEADDSTPFPQNMYVDWLRVYQKAE